MEEQKWPEHHVFKDRRLEGDYPEAKGPEVG